MSVCSLCHRRCRADRSEAVGFCGVPDKIKIARAAPHYFEEPVISGKNGSGAVFFSGCVLRCVYCQNYELSHNAKGKTISREELAEIFLKLQAMGVHNINLVSPTQYAFEISEALKAVKGSLFIPVIYNSSGYDSDEILGLFDGLIDVYLPDLKYFSSKLSERYSACPDYFEVALKAIERMVASVGSVVIEDGLIKKGVIVRHLVLPTMRHDSMRLLRELKERIGTDNVLLSLMHQYTPEFLEDGYPELNRRVTEFEYNSVKALAEELTFRGFSQDRSSATRDYTPKFDLNELKL